MAMKSKSDNFILNEFWGKGIPLGTPGGASGSVTHIGSATVFVHGSVETTIGAAQITTIGGVTPSFTGTAMDVTTTVSMGNIPSIGGATPTFTGGAQHFVLTGASPVDATYIGDIKFGEELPAGTQHIGSATVYVHGTIVADVTGQGDVPITLGGEAVVLAAGTVDIGYIHLAAASPATYIGDIEFGESLPAGTNVIGAATVYIHGTVVADVTGQGDVPITLDSEVVTITGAVAGTTIITSGTLSSIANVVNTAGTVTLMPSTAHIGSATVFIGGGSVTANMGNIPSIGGVTPSFTGTAMDVTTTVSMGNIPSIGGATPTFTAGAQHVVLTGASTTDGHYLGDIKFGEALPAGAAHIGSATVYVFGGALSATVTLIAGGQVSATVTPLASEVHLGEVGGNSIITTVTLTAGTVAYTVGDLFADTQPIAGVMRVTGGKAVLQSLTVIDQDDQGAAMDLVFLPDLGSFGTENSAVSVADAVANTIQGIVEVASTDYVDLINSQVAHKENTGIVVQATAGTTSLHVAAITRGTPTLTTVDSVHVKLGWLRD